MVALLHGSVEFMTVKELIKRHSELAPNTKDVASMVEMAMIITEIYSLGYHWDSDGQKWRDSADNKEV
jgi:hypothetical protein